MHLWSTLFRHPGIRVPRYLPGFRGPGIRVPRYLRGFRNAGIRVPRYLQGFRSPGIRVPRYLRGFPEFESHDICEVFRGHGLRVPRYLRGFSRPRTSSPTISTSRNSSPMIFAMFFEARTSSPTIFPRQLRVSPAYYVCTAKIDFPATEAPAVRGVLHFTKVDFPATEVPGVLRLYYKSRLSSHGSSGCPSVLRLYYKNRLSSQGSSGRPRRTACVLQKSTFQPRKSPAYYVCTTNSRLPSHGRSTTEEDFESPTERTSPAQYYFLYYKARFRSKKAKTRWFQHRDHGDRCRGLTRTQKKCKTRWF